MTPRDVHPVILFDDLKKEVGQGGSVELVVPSSQSESAALWRVFLTMEDVRYMLVRPRNLRPYEIKTPKGLFSFLRSLGITEIMVPVPSGDDKD